MRHAALAIAFLTACDGNTIVLAPVIDIPVNDTAQALDLDSITLSVAHAGEDADIVSATFTRGDRIALPGVPYGDDLVVHMVGRVGSVEIAYGRTCRFSVRPDGRLPTPHLYFAREVKFGQMSVMPLPRLDGIAITYRDGSGLLIGGHTLTEANEREPIRAVERFDPNNGEYETLHEIERRLDAAVSLLGTGPDSRVVVVGGVDPASGAGAQFVEVIEADRFTDRQYDMFFEPQMPVIGLSATELSDGRVVAIGGRYPVPPDPMGPPISSAVAEVGVTSGITAVRLTRAHLAFPRYRHTATRLADDVGAAVLVAGGLDKDDLPVAKAELYKPLTEGFSMGFNPEMVVPRSQHQAVRLPDGSVLIVGGIRADGQPTAVVEVFSLDAGFRAFGEMPLNAGLVGITATALPDGRVLLAGGRRTLGGPPTNNAFIARLDPLGATIDIVATDRMAFARAGHQATRLCDGTILISGGTPTPSPYERYNPPALGRR